VLTLLSIISGLWEKNTEVYEVEQLLKIVFDKT
jgi:hypothetical protein